MNSEVKEVKFVSYLRVSTERQGKSGLGVEAQREAVRQHVAGVGCARITSEFVEIESGKQNNRPELAKALKLCRLTGAVLIVAKLDRLSRNAAFLMTLRDSGAEFVAADLPGANMITVGVMALVAQQEREAISARTKAALAAAKERNVKLGGRRPGGAYVNVRQSLGVLAARAKADAKASELSEMLDTLSREGLSLNGIAARLNAAEVLTSRGVAKGWTATSVRRMRDRLS